MGVFLSKRVVFRILPALWVLGFFSWNSVAQEHQDTYPLMEDPWFFVEVVTFSKGDRVNIGSAVTYCDQEQVYRSSLKDILASQEKLWEYLTHPETPSCKRLKAASFGASDYDLKRLPLLDEALELLSQYTYVVGDSEERDTFKKIEPMEILGFHWDPPKAQIPRPENDAQYAATPWPWQVYRALRRLRAGLKNRVQKIEDRQIWFEWAMEEPCASPSEAGDFNSAMEWALRFKPTEDDWSMLEEVIGAWRSMALSPFYKDSNARIPSFLSSFHSQWFYTPKRWVPQALLLEILKDAPDPEMKLRVLKALKSHRNGFDGINRRLWPVPATLTLAGLDFLNRGEGSEMDQLRGAKFLIDVFYKPIPMHIDLREGQSPHKVKAQLDKAMQWLETKRESLEKASLKELPNLEAATRWIPRSSPCGW